MAGGTDQLAKGRHLASLSQLLFRQFQLAFRRQGVVSH